MLLTSPLSSPLKNPLRDGFSSTGGSSITAQVQALFAGGKVGGMWDMGDTATLFQDAAGATPVTAVTQPIGRVNDKSGNGNHATQPTAINRPLYQVDGGYGSAQFDGVNDGLVTAAMSLTPSMDCFIALKKTGTAQQIVFYGGPGQFCGVLESGAGSSATDLSGAPTYFVNGIAVPGGTAVTRDQLYNAVPLNQWVVLEIRGLDLSAYPYLGFANYSGGGKFQGSIDGVVAISSPSTAERNLIRTYLGSKVGLTL